MDSLSQLIGSLRVASAVYTRFEATSPWGHRVSHPGRVKFVLVSDGACWLRVASLPAPLELRAGDLFLVLDGAPYMVSDRPNARCLGCEELEARREGFLVRYGGGGAATTLVSVALELAPDDDGALVGALPPFIHLRRDGHRGSSYALTELLREEIREDLGSVPIVRRLAEALFISAVRDHVRSCELPKHGLLAAVADPQLRRALQGMHDDVARRWTVEDLAASAGMSRASFASKFKSAAGVPPLEYLTQRRIACARGLLRDNVDLAEIATRVGYDSTVSFARAFRRVAGASPGAFRREHRSSAGG